MATQKLHWMAVGEVTENARQRIKSLGGLVKHIDAGPLPIVLVGIPCQLLPAHERYTEVQVQTWPGSEEAIVTIPSLTLELSWSCQSGVPPTQASISETVLDLFSS